MTETIEVPKEPFVEHVIERMKEVGRVKNHPEISPSGRGPKLEVDWSFSGIDWDVEITDGGFDLVGVTEGAYSVQTLTARYNPPGKAHPAEYENRTCEVAVTVHVDTENPPDGLWDYETDVMVI